ncbi:MAG: ABC transporter substrate-binding protein [Acidimicrobiaceae bacterium]|nr:MAG: hypothetical protein MB53_05685 [marine actinobacterium MedAcidi-G2A]MAT02207.1 ABC transporter substrate-binding protein [Acidimicrobiaceae bacterium]MBA4811001.1 ABC transporter substrate-binding protein [Acidimicrobiales bacterium]OUV00381.1 MAG: branched-chain amino acid ABC transporter substrate-binding protein [Acidimicrobiaceae bacterium TMED77]|tara:strand:- start:6690 stop:7934 length:1245 start_codon:yes stop_codon:yes gene_type:complete
MRNFSLLPILFALSICLSACSSQDDPASIVEEKASPSNEPATVFQDTTEIIVERIQQEDTIVVGVIIDEENLMSPHDRQPGVAFVGAMNQLNETGGILGKQVTVLRVNSESRLSVVDNAAKKLIEAGAQLLVVTCELDYASPAIRRAKEAEVLVISPCATETEWSTGSVDTLAFSMTTQSQKYGLELANLLWEEGKRTVGVLWDNSTPETIQECSAFKSRWRALGGRTTIDKAINMVTATDIINAGDRARTLDADSIVLCSFNRVGTLALQRIRGAGWLTPVIAGLTMDSAAFRPLDVSGIGDFRLLSFASTSNDDPYPEVRDAAVNFVSVDGVPPASGRFVLGADLAKLWIYAVNQVGTTKSSTVAEEIKSITIFDAVSGPISFNGTQSVLRRVLRVLEQDDGEMIFQKTWEY